MEETCQKILDIDSVLEELKGQKREIESKISKLDTLRTDTTLALIAEMQECGCTMTEYQGLKFTVKKKPQGVIVTDEKLLPEDYWRVKKEINKAKINLDMKDGKEVPGATFDNGGYSLQVAR